MTVKEICGLYAEPYMLNVVVFSIDEWKEVYNGTFNKLFMMNEWETVHITEHGKEFNASDILGMEVAYINNPDGYELVLNV